MDLLTLFAVALLSAASSNSFAQQQNQNDALVNTSKNNIIQSLQLRVIDTPDCAHFKQQLKDAGQTADGGNNNQFTRDIRKVVSNIKSAGCIAQPEAVAGY